MIKLDFRISAITGICGKYAYIHQMEIDVAVLLFIKNHLIYVTQYITHTYTVYIHTYR